MVQYIGMKSKENKKTPYQTTWNLTPLFKNDKDPEIEKTIVRFESACKAFEKKYKNKDFTSTPKSLRSALDDYYKSIVVVRNGNQAWWYFGLKQTVDSGNQLVNASATKINKRYTEAENLLTFFHLKIASINPKDYKKFLTAKEVEPYRYQLSQVFLKAKYKLTEAEEKILSLTEETSYDMWVDGQSKVLSQKTVKWKGKDISYNQGAAMIASLGTADRKKMHGLCNQVYKDCADFAEAEMNAIVNYKATTDKLRGYKTAQEATILGYQNDFETVKTLVDTVSSEFSLSHRYYKTVKKILGLNQMGLQDRNVVDGNIKTKFDFDSAVTLVRDAFNSFGPEFGAYIDSYLANGQIDAFPRAGKRGGAFCWGQKTSNLPIYVMLNHVDDVRSVTTFAHEMGHAIHGELSGVQPLQYRAYTISTAEVASTFFEQILFDSLIEKLPQSEQKILLQYKIADDVSTIFRQIAFYNFEDEMHKLVRDKGTISKDDYAALMQKHLKSYLGPAIDVTSDDGYYFVTLSHIRNFFYVYTYAIGSIISRSLYEMWKKDPSVKEKIVQFLSAGGSESPRQIFARLGIDIADKNFIKAGLKSLENDIARFEKLSKAK